MSKQENFLEKQAITTAQKQETKQGGSTVTAIDKST
jgi:hypothetical protein